MRHPILLLLLLVAVVGAAELPLGHPEFLPTAERPIGFRGDWTGSFPGATPVTHFYEAPHQVVDNPGEGQHWPKQVVAFTDGPSHNLVWKTRMPGWSLSQPITVGDRVFALADPHFLLCLDAHCGELLWQREMLPLQGTDRDEAEARRLQPIVEIGRAADILLTIAEDPKHADAVAKRLQEWKEQVAAIDPHPGILGAFDKVLGMVAQVKAGEKVKFGSFPGGNGIIGRAIVRRYQVPISQTWFGMVSYIMATPTSDGESVFATAGQGQVVAYDLEGGLRWAVRLPMSDYGLHVAHGESPRLVGDVLVVSNGDSGAIFGLDKRTGKTLWQVDDAGGAYKNHGLFHPRTADGTVVPVIIPRGRQIIRVRDGKVVGQLDYWDGGPFELTTHGTADLLYANRSWNTHAGASILYRLEARSTDEVVSVRLRELGDGEPRPPKGESGSSFKLNGNGEGVQSVSQGFLWYGGQSFDLRTGRVVASNVGGGSRSPLVIGGTIGFSVFESAGGNGYGGPRRADGKVPPGEVRTWDLRVPSVPVPLTQGNLLGAEELCSDIYLENHLQGFDRWLFAGCYHGWPANFGGAFTGVYAAGNRLFLQSHSFVYCIGDPSEPFAGVAVLPESRAAASAATPALLAQATSAKTRRERLIALDALYRSGDTAAADAVKKLLTDPDRLVRQRAAGVLGRLGAAAGDPAGFVRTLGGTDPAEAETAAIVLRGLGAAAAGQAEAIIDLATGDAPDRRWALLACEGLGEAGVQALAPRLEQPATFMPAAAALDRIAGCEAAKAELYFGLLRRRDTIRVDKVHLGYARLSPYDAEMVWPTIANRFLLASLASPTELDAYAGWIQAQATATDKKQRQRVTARDLLPLLLAGGAEHRSAALKLLEGRLREEVNGGDLEVAKILGADAAPLLPVLREAAAGTVPRNRHTPAWQVESAIAHIGTLAGES